LRERALRRRRPAEENRKQILEAAKEVFSRNGFHGTDVNEIAYMAGLGKGTVYRYFGSKRGLFLSLVDWGMNLLREEISQKIKYARRDPVKALKAAIKAYIIFFEKNMEFYWVLVQEVGGYRNDNMVERKYFPNLDLLENLLRFGIEKGIFKPVDARSSAVALLGIANSLIYQGIISGNGHTVHRKLPAVLDIFIKGIIKN
jgi:AcrR family transcriptional regulator